MTFDPLLRGLFSQTGKSCLEGQSGQSSSSGAYIINFTRFKILAFVGILACKILLQLTGLPLVDFWDQQHF